MFSNVELSFFFKQLHYLTKRGISLYPALELIYFDVGNKSLKKPLDIILKSLREGESFSLILHEKIQVPLFIANIISIGENEGTLDTAFSKASRYLQTKMELNQKVQTALAYPLVLLIFGISILSWIMLKILPQFREIYEQAGILLPLPTRILFAVHTFIISYWWTFPLLFILSFLVLFFILGKELKMFFAKIYYKIPIIGSFAYHFTLMNFLSNLGSLHSSGVSLIKSLHLTINITPNIYFKSLLQTVIQKVLEGERLSVALWETGFFPAIIVKMVMAGEESAELDKILVHLTDYIHEELDISMKRTISMIGPVSLMIIGFFIAFIAISFLLPLFRMTGAIHGAA